MYNIVEVCKSLREFFSTVVLVNFAIRTGASPMILNGVNARWIILTGKTYMLQMQNAVLILLPGTP